MTTAVNLRKMLDRKQWEPLSPLPIAPGNSGPCIIATPPNWPVPMALYIWASAGTSLYNISEDAWLQLPTGSLGTFAAGTCGCFHPYGPSFTASAGSTTTATSTLTIPGSLAGYKMRCTAGTGAGQEVTIVSNTYGANSVITFAAVGTGFDNTSVFQIMSGRFWFLAATAGAVTWKFYDVATNTWTAKSVTSGPASNWGADGACIATAGLCCTSAVGGFAGAIASGTATAGAAATLTNSGKAWATNQWANFQVRIVSGTGAGQIRTINSNTGTVLTVSANWATNPDATSVYVIEGNDDWIWVIGNNNVALFRYAINGIAGLSANAQATGDTWITIAPGAARAVAAGTGSSLNWVSDSTDATFTAENANLNGRRLYSFRGGGTNVLDVYDIPSNTWALGPITYNRQSPTFNSGTSYTIHKGIIYINDNQGGNTANLYRFNCATQTLDPLPRCQYPPAGSGYTGQKVFVAAYYDGATEIDWVYVSFQLLTPWFRLMLI
jgi:hypothetical protein